MSKSRSGNGTRHPHYDFLPPEPLARKRIQWEKPCDVTDAEFVVIDKATASMRFNDNQPPTRKADASQWLILTMRLMVTLIKLVEKGLGQLSARNFAALVGLLAITVFWLAGGLSLLVPDQVVAMPARAELVITDIGSRIETANGMNSLVVNARVENNSRQSMSVPAIRLELISGAALIRTAEIQPPQNRLQPGQKADFLVRLSHPGGKQPQIHLSFVTDGGTAR